MSSSTPRKRPAARDPRGGDLNVPAEIECVDCGGRCYLLSHEPPDEGFRPGDIVAYRCGDCLDRWDLVVPDEQG